MRVKTILLLVFLAALILACVGGLFSENRKDRSERHGKVNPGTEEKEMTPQPSNRRGKMLKPYDPQDPRYRNLPKPDDSLSVIT